MTPVLAADAVPAVPAGARPDPSVQLVAAYRRAEQRMTGLAFVNPALEVEAVGFAPWGGCWLGVLVTPWFMNLVLAPHDPAQWPAVAAGAKHSFDFPAGRYEFIGARDEVVGEFLSCSLFSPVQEFEDQATARLVAVLAREALFDDDNVEAPEAPLGERALTPAPAPVAPREDVERAPLAAVEKALEAPLSKRDFLRGGFFKERP